MKYNVIFRVHSYAILEYFVLLSISLTLSQCVGGEGGEGGGGGLFEILNLVLIFQPHPLGYNIYTDCEVWLSIS